MKQSTHSLNVNGVAPVSDAVLRPGEIHGNCENNSAALRPLLPRGCVEEPGRHRPRQHSINGAGLAAAAVHHDVLPAWRLARDGAVSVLSHL